jgi:hypothetical protein
MDTFNIICGIVTIIAFGFSLYVYIRTEIFKANEVGNMAVRKEQLRYLHTGLGTIFTALDAIVQTPTRPAVSVGHLLTPVKVARDQAFALMRSIGDFETDLKEWRFGKMIPSTTPASSNTLTPPSTP